MVTRAWLAEIQGSDRGRLEATLDERVWYGRDGDEAAG